MKTIIGVVDYEVGNQFSLISALKSNNCKVILSKFSDELDEAEILVLPGVGAFKTAIENLRKNKIFDYLKKKSDEKKPIIGICLGMQLLATDSFENGYHKGLDIIPGRILPLKKINIGWAKILGSKKHFKKLNIDKKYFYFNHGFYFHGQKSYTLSVIEDNKKCPSIIKYKNNIGVQFHPEKSQKDGADLLNKLVHGDFFG